jgi:hypothetical protein
VSEAQVLGFIMHLLVVFLCVGAACWLTACGAGWARARVWPSGRRDRRDRAALRAEAARGLAQIEEFLRAGASACGLGESSSPEPGGNASQDPHLCGGNGTEGSDGSDG